MEKAEKRKPYSAEQKCRAVLSVWSERRSPKEVCRGLGITWNILNHWEARAMEGMLQALHVPTEKGVALNPRLALLLEKKIRGGSRLERRLVKLQANPEEMPETEV